METAKTKTISVEEYFARESESETKSEYCDGEMFAMTGASFRHNLIVSNIITAFNIALRGKDCYVLPSDIKVELDFDRRYVYPDVTVVCGEAEMARGRDDVVANPKIVVEVLSKSTMDYDKGSKFTAYRGLSSLTDFIAADQYTAYVEHYRKQGPGLWTLRECSGLEGSLVLSDFEVPVALSDIYNRVDFGGK